MSVNRQSNRLLKVEQEQNTAGDVVNCKCLCWFGATYVRVTGKLGHDRSLVNQSLLVRCRKISSAHFDGDIVCWPPPFTRLVKRTPGIQKRTRVGRTGTPQTLDRKD